MFLSNHTVKGAFLTLAELEKTAKTGMERTSGLFFFLAFDMVQNLRGGEEVVPLSPKGDVRKRMARCYSELVAIPAGDTEWMVTDLGEVNYTEARTPEKKIGGDLFTTLLKQASEKRGGMDYPRRAPGKLLRLGEKINGEYWGVRKHPEWRDTLPHFMNNRRSAFPWTALAVFVLRDYEWSDHAGGSVLDFVTALRGQFTENLCVFWGKRMRHESRKFAEFGGAKFQKGRPMTFGLSGAATDKERTT